MAVMVLGMHRSGTSAVARLVSLLGAKLSRDTDIIQDRDDNPHGHWESAALYKINEALLFSLGGCWCLPPRLEGEWWRNSVLQQSYRHARNAFLSVYDVHSEWAWKDPRNCIVLPYWIAALECQPAVVFVHRNPLEVHASLERRNSFTREIAVELWEIYNRSAISNCQGLPVFSVGFEELLAKPQDVTSELAGFLRSHAAISKESATIDGQAVDNLRSDLRHHRFESASAQSALSPSQWQLLQILKQLPLHSDSFRPPELPKRAEQSALAGLSKAIGPVIAALKNSATMTMMQLEQLRSQIKAGHVRVG